MRDRSATNTIKGYFYQFDYSILTILKLSKDTDAITIEGIEDVDVSELEGDSAIQCKYYANTEYNHSEIAQPIRFMLKDYKERKDTGKTVINYKLYGYYSKGQHKLPTPLTIEFLKEHFLTYSHDKLKILYHQELKVSDAEIKNFLEHLQIQINAEEFLQQSESIFQILQEQFECSRFEAEHYYYNNALKIIKDLAIQQDINERKIYRKEFIELIDKKEILFNQWFYFFRSQKEVFKKLRKEYFSDFNVLPFERFFLIEVDKSNYSIVELIDILRLISIKWSKLSRLTPKPFCPYIYIHNLEPDELVNLKIDLQKEGFCFIDGFPFNGATFNPKVITKCANYHNQIQIKLIDRLDYINLILNEIDKTKEIYQFYRVNPYFEISNTKIRHVKIQNNHIKDIKEII